MNVPMTAEELWEELELFLNVLAQKYCQLVNITVLKRRIITEEEEVPEETEELTKPEDIEQIDFILWSTNPLIFIYFSFSKISSSD